MSDHVDVNMNNLKSQDFSSTVSTYTPPPVANPSPLGLAAFGVTTFVFSCYNANITVPAGSPPTIVLGLALFYGGLVQLLAGQWEFKAGNTFEATVFSSYGAFWLSFAMILIIDLLPFSDEKQIVQGIAASHELGIYHLAWTIFTFMMFLCVLRQNIAMILLFGTLVITFALLTVKNFEGNHQQHLNTGKAAGVTGIIASIISFYVVLASLASKERTFFTLPVGSIGEIEKMFLRSM